MKKCPSCGKENSDSSIYCSSCGKELPIDVTLDNDKQAKFCINCGKKISKKDTFCPYCGSTQDASEIKKKQELNKEEENENKKETKEGQFSNFKKYLVAITSCVVGFLPIVFIFLSWGHNATNGHETSIVGIIQELISLSYFTSYNAIQIAHLVALVLFLGIGMCLLVNGVLIFTNHRKASFDDPFILTFFALVLIDFGLLGMKGFPNVFFILIMFVYIVAYYVLFIVYTKDNLTNKIINPVNILFLFISLMVFISTSNVEGYQGIRLFLNAINQFEGTITVNIVLPFIFYLVSFCSIIITFFMQSIYKNKKSNCVFTGFTFLFILISMLVSYAFEKDTSFVSSLYIAPLILTMVTFVLDLFLVLFSKKEKEEVKQ